MIRTRRNRKSASVRALVQEYQLRASKLVYPLFVLEDDNDKQEIKTLPGQYRLGLNHLKEIISKAISLDVTAFMLFPVVSEDKKDAQASYAINPNNFYYRVVRELKSAFPECTFISDIALDPYSSDGHDGLVKDGEILNDATLPILAQMAVMQSEAGFDVLGPSDMMDGRIGVLRNALETKMYSHTSIMSYCAKYASSYYGPFRDALESAPKSGDKKSYQMDYHNRKEAMRELAADELEGADFLMVKPAMAYLDIISDFKQNSDLPIAAYHVSGEYAMLKMGAANGLFNYEAILEETLTAIHRAGADIIITYAALEMAEILTS